MCRSQLPEDLIRLQEVVNALQPDVMIETGIYSGGSLLFHATLCEGLGKGRVIGIDKHIPQDTHEAITRHRLSHRIEMIEGDSIAPATVGKVYGRVRPAENVLVVLDSHHSKEHVAGELRAYAPLVTPGSFIIAADGIMRDLTDVPGGDPAWLNDNPAAAALEFAASHPEFELRQPRLAVQSKQPRTEHYLLAGRMAPEKTLRSGLRSACVWKVRQWKQFEPWPLLRSRSSFSKRSALLPIVRVSWGFTR